MRNPRPETWLAATLATIRPDWSGHHHAVAAETLCRIGRRARRLCLERCNGVSRYDATEKRMRATFTEADEKRHDKAHARLRKEAVAILSEYGVAPATVGTDDDPRGPCLSWRFAGQNPPNNSFAKGWSI
jgi:hypothetical protein